MVRAYLNAWRTSGPLTRVQLLIVAAECLIAAWCFAEAVGSVRHPGIAALFVLVGIGGILAAMVCFHFSRELSEY